MISSKVVQKDCPVIECLGENNGRDENPLSPVFQELRSDARRLGIQDDTLSAIVALTRWKEFLNAPADSPDRTLRECYLTTMGFMPARSQVIAQAVRSKNRVEQVYPALMNAFAKGVIDPEEFVGRAAEDIKAQFPGLSKSQAELLREIMRQQRRLDLLKPAELVRQFPFPITEHNFFGRFICSGCDSPQKAIRHLQISNSFFITMKSLLEGLSNDGRSFLSISIKTDEDEDDETADGSGYQDIEPEMVADLIQECVNNASDLTGRQEIGIDNSLCCIEMPRLPTAESKHIDCTERDQLAVELFDWLLYGKRDGILLNKQALSTERETKYEETVKRLDEVKKRLYRHRLNKPKVPRNIKTSLNKGKFSSEKDKEDQGGGLVRGSKEFKLAQALHAHQGRVKDWDEKLKTFLKMRDRLMQEIKGEDAARRKMRPIIRQLEAEDSLSPGIGLLRKEVRRADEHDRKICFSFLKTSGRPNIFLHHLDRAYATKKFNSNPGISCIKSACLLINEQIEIVLSGNRIAGFQSAVDQQVRRFEIQSEEISTSLQFILARILPDKPDPQVALLVNTLKNIVPMPGVNNRKELGYLVSQACGKGRPKAEDYLQYAFEHSAYLSQDELVNILEVMREFNIPSLPERCRQIAVDRFRHSAAFLNKVELYNDNYRPQKIGDLPVIFEDQATLQTYLRLQLDSYGMKREVEAIDRHLRNDGIVAVIDGTNYHPELAGSGDSIGGSVESDQEDTEEIWGDYVRPSERLIRAFSRRLMEGDVSEELQNHSLISVHRPGKVEKIFQAVIKKMYGISLDITPDLSQVNQLLADLTLYDENTILVVDAQSVEDFEQYREFIGLLEKYRLKIILRTREPFPGVPQVLIQPFMEYELTDRLSVEADSLGQRLGLDRPPSKEILDFAAMQVRRLRQPGADPLNLTLQVIHGAAQNVRMKGGDDKVLMDQDIVAAIPPIFHLPDAEQMRVRCKAIDAFVDKAPLEVLGQKEAISKIGSRMKQQILALRDPTRPLTIMIPGPTGVGKTELMIKFAQICDMPFFHIEGAEFSEHHTVFRLVGSPSGYVGDDEGILYKFLKSNNTALVFIDELEKMHPDCYQYLLNFFDKATITAGHGGTVVRPGIVIVGATNAGAEKLYRGMNHRQVLDVLSESFRDRNNNPRPELVRRFECVPMLAIDHEAFSSAIEVLLKSVGTRHGVINANLRLVGVDPSACEMLYNYSKEICIFDEENLRPSKMGFGLGSGQQQGVRIIEKDSQRFYDLRYISRAVDELAGPQIQKVVEEQYALDRHLDRGNPRLVSLVGCKKEGRVDLVDV